MRSAQEHIRDERGLMGKITILWFVLLAVFVVAAWDTASILITRYKVQSAAEAAAVEAATAYKSTNDVEAAKQAALDQIEQQMPGAKLTRDGFKLDPVNGNVTVTVSKRAS
ncbi:MAG: pilus assembly protein TadG-related protein, partial [Actinomycetota bacterium]